jgi:hypothetical protein
MDIRSVADYFNRLPTSFQLFAGHFSIIAQHLPINSPAFTDQ